MILLTFATAIALSVIAAYYSIIGLAAIFTGAFWPIVIMGSVLEASKLVTASWLYRNWHICPRLLKSYLTSKLFLTNQSPNVFFTESNCLMIDSKIYNVPMLTLADASSSFVKELDERDTMRNIVPIRWITDNDENDMRKLQYWRSFSDLNINFNNAFIFLSEYYKFRKINIELIAILKIWSLFNTTYEFELRCFRKFSHIESMIKTIDHPTKL
jgi:hypothetical protein